MFKFLPFLLIVLVDCSLIGDFFKLFPDFFDQKDKIICFPYIFAPTLSFFTYHQLIRWTCETNEMKAAYKESGSGNYLKWYFAGEKSAQRIDKIDQFIFYHHGRVSKDYSEFARLFLIFSSRFVQIEGELYIPWHLLQVLLEEQAILEKDYRPFIKFDNKMSQYDEIGDKIEHFSIFRQPPYRLCLSLVLRLKEKKLLRQRTQKDDEVYLILKETARTFAKYAQLSGDRRGVAIWRGFLRKLQRLRIKATWNSFDSSLYETMTGNISLVEQLNMTMLNRTIIGLRLVFFSASVLLFVISFILYCFRPFI